MTLLTPDHLQAMHARSVVCCAQSVDSFHGLLPKGPCLCPAPPRAAVDQRGSAVHSILPALDMVVIFQAPSRCHHAHGCFGSGESNGLGFGRVAMHLTADAPCLLAW